MAYYVPYTKQEGNMFIKIKRGRYLNALVENLVFPLTKGYTVGKKGGFVTVDATGILPDRGVIRVKVNKGDFEILNEDGTTSDGYSSPQTLVMTQKSDTDEPEDVVIQRIQERFDILEEMTCATIKGDVRAMIVVGPPGIGKSFGVEKELQKNGLIDDLAGRKRRYEIVKGAMTPIGLYAKLFEFSEEGMVLVFDDCDSILLDDISLNVLKAALDSSKKRTIHWNSDSRLLRSEGIPNKFDFKGAVIFITNIKFDHVRSAKLRDHLDALMSRCHYLDLSVDSTRDKLLRIKQIARTGQLFPAYGMDAAQEEEIIQYMEDNHSRLRELSLRMAIKLADLRRLSSGRWKNIAENTCIVRK